MKTTTPARQRGAVVILVGFVLIVLIGFAGLVIDLGRLYVAKTELQNAADAAALAGAKFLDGTALGVQKAVHGTNNNDTLNGAIYTAGLHRYDFTSKPVTITIANISVGDCPDDSCMVAASSVTSDAIAAGKTFLKVDTSATSQQTFSTFLMQVLRIFAPGTASSTQTFGMAVAGRFVAEVAPIGVCAIDPNHETWSDSNGELREFGFRRGIAYNIPELNPLGNKPGVPIWINPIDTPPATCSPSNSSASNLAPFLCTGHSALTFSSMPTLVYANTGGSYGPQDKALNSRFYPPDSSSPCDPASAPTDSNVHPYNCVGGSACGPSAIGLPRNWMDPSTTLPTQQSISIDPATRLPPDIDTATRLPNATTLAYSQYGALWSYSRAVHAVPGDVAGTWKAGAPFNATNTDWTTLYAAQSGQPTNYPETSPYTQQVQPFFEKPSGSLTGTPNRRILNIAIMDCTSLPVGTSGLSCQLMTVKGIGKFFMQVPASLTGGNCSPNANKCLYAEFGGLITPIPDAEIKLYR